MAAFAKGGRRDSRPFRCALPCYVLDRRGVLHAPNWRTRPVFGNARQMMFTSRNLMLIVVMLGSIHAAIADEASDAVQVLLKLWKTNFEGSDGVCRGWKKLKTEFVGDRQIYKMRLVNRLEDGKVEEAIDEAPFRFLEEDILGGAVHCRYPRSAFMEPLSVVGVKCLFGRDCFTQTVLTYDPVYNPNAAPKVSLSRGDLRPSDGGPSGPPVLDAYSYGSVDPRNADAVRRALQTLLRLNAAPPFEPPKAPR